MGELTGGATGEVGLGAVLIVRELRLAGGGAWFAWASFLTTSVSTRGAVWATGGAPPVIVILL